MSRNAAILILSCAIFLTALPAGAQEDGAFFVITGRGGTFYHSIPGLAFLPLTPTESYNRFLSNGTISQQGGIENPGGGDTLYLVAPVYLPHGATITNLMISFCGTSGSLYSYLMRKNLKTESLTREIVASTYSEPYGCQEQYDTSINHEVVDNENYMYYLQIYMTADDTLLRAGRITYTIP